MTEFTGEDCFPCIVGEHCKGYRFRKRWHVGTIDARLLQDEKLIFVGLDKYIFNIYVYIKISHKDLVLQLNREKKNCH